MGLSIFFFVLLKFLQTIENKILLLYYALLILDLLYILISINQQNPILTKKIDTPCLAVKFEIIILFYFFAFYFMYILYTMLFYFRIFFWYQFLLNIFLFVLDKNDGVMHILVIYLFV